MSEENKWGVTLEIFMGEKIPRKSPICPVCGKTYYAWSDVEDYCTRCGNRIEGRENLLNDYWNGLVGNYKQDKKIMEERYGMNI